MISTSTTFVWRGIRRLRPRPLQGLLTLATSRFLVSVETTTSNRQEHIVSSLQSLVSSNTDFSINPYALERHGRGESYHPTQKPDVIISPSTVQDISTILRFANDERIAVVPFGAGTSVEGHVCALEGGISLDMSKFQTIVMPADHTANITTNPNMDDVSSIPDPFATVGAGVTRKTLNTALRHTGLQFVVDPGADATLGGMTATGASGTTAVRYGTMRENLLQVECVLPDGTVASTGTKALKSSAGYDLVGLLCGSEGTLGVITSVTVKLHPIPQHVVAAVCVFNSLADAASSVATLKFFEIAVVRCELLDATSIAAFNALLSNDNSNTTPKMEVKPTLFLEFQASSEESLQDQVRMTEAIMLDFGASSFQFTSTEEERKQLWAARHNLYYASLSLRNGATDAIITDACVPLSKFADIIARTAKDVEEKGVVGPCFGHAGDGNFHCILPVTEDDSKEYLDKVHQVNHNLIQRTLAAGGTCTGEHGVGYGKIQYLRQQYGPGAVNMMEAIKKSLDPNGIMNPGKVVRQHRSYSTTTTQIRHFSTSENFERRFQLLDASRGIIEKSINGKKPLPAFPLHEKHFGDHLLLSGQNNNTPRAFHRTLCDLIRDAKKRIYLASLYIGPAASPDQQSEEVELLQVLGDVAANATNISIKVVLDQNRALRSVPLAAKAADSSHETEVETTTSSVKAVAKAIQGPVHLMQVLPSPFDALLPNPLNEVAGVFHIKVYIVDDHLLLSGANLSQEYFCDRQDRYLWICEGGNGLVDFYAKLVDMLCDHSEIYQLGEDGQECLSSPDVSREEFLEKLSTHFQDDSPVPSSDLLARDDVVAVGVPTFFAPSIFADESKVSFVTDKEATISFLRKGASQHDILQLSSAYLNPTSEMISALKEYDNIQLLTAGRLSHGFRPKKKAGNKGKDWIPTVFDHIAHDTLKALSSSVTLFHWERENWTFHAKGIWLREVNQQNEGLDQPVAAAVVGSSNFGERSWVRDMESNLILIFSPDSEQRGKDHDSRISLEPNAPVTSTVSQSFGKDWDELMLWSKVVTDPKESSPPLPWYIQWSFPLIKSFF